MHLVYLVTSSAKLACHPHRYLFIEVREVTEGFLNKRARINKY